MNIILTEVTDETTNAGQKLVDTLNNNQGVVLAVVAVVALVVISVIAIVKHKKKKRY